MDQKGTNTAWIYTVPGYDQHHTFCAELNMDKDEYAPDLAYDANTIMDDEQEQLESEDETQDDNESMTSDSPLDRQDPLFTDFNMDGPKDAPSPMVIIDEEDTMPQGASALFLHWHHRLGHISPKKIRLLAKLGLLPTALVNCRIPLCTSCLFGKAT